MGPVTSEQGAETHPLTKSQPMALEVPVVATGARPGDKSEKRELFSETTQTVLVFEHGGVLPLTAAVAVGQLLFLTNKTSGREIVAQVVRKKDFRPTACYVELEFTESAPGYWGVEFPKASAEKNQEALKGGIPEEFEEAEITEEGAGEAAPPPDQAEVAKLRQEVEALRAQLKSLAPAAEEVKPAPVIEEAKQTAPKPEYGKPAISDKLEEPKPVEVKPEVMRADEPKPELEKMEAPSPVEVKPAEETKIEKIELMSPHEPNPEIALPAPPPQEEVKSLPAAAEPTEPSPSYPIRMQLPKAEGSSNRTSEFAADDATAEHLLPKPSLDFAKYPGSEEPSPKLYSRSARRGLGGPIGALVAIVLLLLVAAGLVTYRMGWLSRSSKKNSSAAMFPANSPNESKPVVKSEATHVTEVTKTDAPPIAKSTPVTTPTPQESNTGHSTESEHPVEATRKPAERAPVEKKSSKHTSAAHEKVTDSNPAGSGDDVVIPPKLLKAIRSLSPPEALRAYASGVVVLDTLVDENGRVASATPISGPKPLYSKAVDTVKDYVYQPATKNGKPVAAHVEVKIQFWYEP